MAGRVVVLVFAGCSEMNAKALESAKVRADVWDIHKLTRIREALHNSPCDVSHIFEPRTTDYVLPFVARRPQRTKFCTGN